MFSRPMKHEQRFHLNRLADKLVTVQRFGSPYLRAIDAPSLVILDEIDCAPDLGIWHGTSTADAANFMAAEYKPPTSCPYGNPDCPLPHWPMGFGKHQACNEDQLRREREAWGYAPAEFAGKIAPRHRESRA